MQRPKRGTETPATGAVPGPPFRWRGDSVFRQAQAGTEPRGASHAEGVGALVVLAEVQARHLVLVVDPQTDDHIHELEEDQGADESEDPGG